MSDKVCACITLRDFDYIVLNESIKITVWRHNGKTRIFIEGPEGTSIQRLKRDGMGESLRQGCPTCLTDET